MKSEALESWLVHIAAGRYPGFCSTKRLGVFLLHLDGMVVLSRSFPYISPLPIYTPGSKERGAVRLKCLAQETNTVPRLGLELGRIAFCGDERTNHSRATVPHTDA